MSRTSMDMTRGSLKKQILFFSIPLMLSNLLQVLFNMSDIAVIGQFAGAMSLGAEVGFGDGTFGVSCQPGGRIDPADFGSFYIARCAGAFKYEGGADRQGRSVHPDLFPGDSGACAL